ncbi:PTS transporter subunit EIIB [Pseudocitrobacter faecalis]
MTPGREEDSAADEDVRLFSKQDFKDKVNASTPQSPLFAQQIIDALGGPHNISQFDNCISRLRVEVIDPSRVASDDVWKKPARERRRSRQ